MENYNPIPIELYWQNFFENNQTFKTNNNFSKKRNVFHFWYTWWVAATASCWARNSCESCFLRRFSFWFGWD